MREQFEVELSGITDRLVTMSTLTEAAVAQATDSLLRADLSLAETVIDGDKVIDGQAASLEADVQILLVRQQPVVATDLRLTLTALRMAGDLERMGDLAVHVAKLTRLRYPATAIPEELRSTIERMGQVAVDIVSKARTVIQTRDLSVAAELEVDDDAMDALHRGLFTAMLSPDFQHGIEAAVDVTLCSRYYERFADHAVSLARRVTYLVTGEHPNGG